MAPAYLQIQPFEFGSEFIFQWAWVVQNVSSEFVGGRGWDAQQILGPPKVYPKYGDQPGAWGPKFCGKTDSIVLRYEHAVLVGQVDIYEVRSAGSVTLVQVGSSQCKGKWETIYKRDSDTRRDDPFDPASYAQIVEVKVPESEAERIGKVDLVSITVRSTRSRQSPAIDAVELKGFTLADKPQPYFSAPEEWVSSQIEKMDHMQQSLRVQWHKMLQLGTNADIYVSVMLPPRKYNSASSSLQPSSSSSGKQFAVHRIVLQARAPALLRFLDHLYFQQHNKSNLSLSSYLNSSIDETQDTIDVEVEGYPHIWSDIFLGLYTGIWHMPRPNWVLLSQTARQIKLDRLYKQCADLIVAAIPKSKQQEVAIAYFTAVGDNEMSLRLK